jgi:hypothetical protein
MATGNDQAPAASHQAACSPSILDHLDRSVAPARGTMCRAAVGVIPASFGRYCTPGRSLIPLEKQRRPVRFAPIWPISVHYFDHSRHAARSEPRGRAARLWTAHGAPDHPPEIASAAGNAIAPRRRVIVPPHGQRAEDGDARAANNHQPPAHGEQAQERGGHNARGCCLHGKASAKASATRLEAP